MSEGWSFQGRTYQFTSAEFKKKKRAYQEKYGQTIYVPGFEDIIHTKRFSPMTEDETKLWKGRKYDDIPPERREEIQHEKARKKEKFLAMLASPSPDIANNVGTIMCALDDAQDAVATLACVATIIAKVSGAVVGKALIPYIGWAWLASDLMNMINPYSRMRKYLKTDSSGRKPKRKKDWWTEHNPTSKKGKLKTAKRIRKFLPTSANVCEAAQTTDQLFGVGLSLGPVVGFLQDIAFTGAKPYTGEFVNLKFTPRARKEWTDVATKTLHSNIISGMYLPEKDLEPDLIHRFGAYMANFVVHPYVSKKAVVESLLGIRDVLYHAPEPTDTLTVEIMEEELGPEDKRIGLPGIGGTVAPLAEIDNLVHSLAKEKHEKFATENTYNAEAMIASEMSCITALNTLTLIDDPENVETDYVVQSKIIHKIYNNGWMYPEDISMQQVNSFMMMTDAWESSGYNPSSKEIQSLAKLHCGFEFVPARHLSGW